MQFFKPRGFPADLTSYDLVKFTALALMVVDHLGAFFYPEEMWLRAIGRLSAPIWFFLIGYARSRDLSAPIWIGMALLMISSLVFEGGMFPVNILGTMIVCRLALDPLMNVIRHAPRSLYPVTALLFLLTIVTFPFIEYGSLAMLVVMLGYMTRNRDSLPFDRGQFLEFTIVVAFCYYMMTCFVFFSFDFYQNVFIGLGLLFVLLGMTCFQPRTYPGLADRLPRPLAWVLKIGGRYSLEFFVLHLILFKALAVYLGINGHSFFSFHIN